jgi:hypothetical protein
MAHAFLRKRMKDGPSFSCRRGYRKTRATMGGIHELYQEDVTNGSLCISCFALHSFGVFCFCVHLQWISSASMVCLAKAASMGYHGQTRWIHTLLVRVNVVARHGMAWYGRGGDGLRI